MSTYFYDLKGPWGNVEVEENPDQYRMILWDNQGTLAGTLTVRIDVGHDAIRHFFGDDPVCQTYYDGKGRILCKFRKPRTATLLSEYGDLTNVNEIRKKCLRWHDSKSETATDKLT